MNGIFTELKASNWNRENVERESLQRAPGLIFSFRGTLSHYLSVSVIFFSVKSFNFVVFFVLEIFDGASKSLQEKWERRGRGGDTILRILQLLRSSISKRAIQTGTSAALMLTTAQTTLFAAALVGPTAAVKVSTMKPL